MNGCVGIAVKALLMHLCSNNHRTWEECSPLLLFSFLPDQTSSPANEQSKQVTHVRCCVWRTPVAFSGFKTLNQVQLMVSLADQI